MLPDPQAVALAIVDEARSGALAFNLGATLARVARVVRRSRWRSAPCSGS